MPDQGETAAVREAALLDRARAWLAEDPDRETRDELARLVAAGDTRGIADRFAGPLEFGTAGLRGELGAGPRRMNRAVVIRASAGLAAYLRRHGGGTVVVGHDARHKSAVFARDAAAVFAGAGLAARLLPGPTPTPVIAFAVRHLGCAAGVVVTASHNPPRDNGYKVYLADGAQIAPPVDREIAAEIAAVGTLADVSRSDSWTDSGDEVVPAYLDRVAGLLEPGGLRALDVVYTPLHGVGRDLLLGAFTRAGFAPPRVVARQGDPDPDFPTVAFPNPEEPGAMDLALAQAGESGADLVIANDPDADRCAVAVPSAGGRWRMLRGDEVGALLATHLVRRGARGVFATTIVSSSLLRRIAAAHGLGYAETLTGFKWLARVEGLRYAYEEALGYCVDPDGVRDKDGISAALLVAELAATLRAEGRTLADLLDEIAREHGVHATDQLAIRVPSAAEAGAALARLRADPPRSLGGRPVTAADDLAHGLVFDPASVSGALPPTDALRYRLGEHARVVIRPSGTEPKLKCYLEVVVPVGRRGPAGVEDARGRAARDLAALRRDVAARLAS